MAKTTFWVKMYFAEFCAHYDGMSDAEIVADVRASRKAFMNVISDLPANMQEGSFAAHLIKRADERIAKVSEMRSEIGKKGGNKSAEVRWGNRTTEQPKEQMQKRTRKPATPRIGYGPQQNILLTEADYTKLSAEIPGLDSLIAKMSEWCKAKGHAYKDYAAALRMWHRKDAESSTTTQTAPKSFQQMERDRQAQLMREWYPDVMENYGL